MVLRRDREHERLGFTLGLVRCINSSVYVPCHAREGNHQHLLTDGLVGGIYYGYDTPTNSLPRNAYAPEPVLAATKISVADNDRQVPPLKDNLFSVANYMIL